MLENVDTKPILRFFKKVRLASILVLQLKQKKHTQEGVLFLFGYERYGLESPLRKRAGGTFLGRGVEEKRRFYMYQ